MSPREPSRLRARRLALTAVLDFVLLFDGGNAVFLVRPGAKVDHLAALRAKRFKAVFRNPGYGRAASRAIDGTGSGARGVHGNDA